MSKRDITFNSKKLRVNNWEDTEQGIHGIDVVDRNTKQLVAWAYGKCGSEVEIQFDLIGYF